MAGSSLSMKTSRAEGNIQKYEPNFAVVGLPFRLVTPCTDVIGYRLFGGPCCLHLKGDGGSMVLRNVGILHHCTLSRFRRPRYESYVKSHFCFVFTSSWVRSFLLFSSVPGGKF
jgi:hypothetical protein